MESPKTGKTFGTPRNFQASVACANPQGTPNLAAAYEFINFAMRPEQQKIYTEKMAYGPSNNIAASFLDKSLASDLPTAPENMKNALKIDVDFWLEYGESLEERF